MKNRLIILFAFTLFSYSVVSGVAVASNNATVEGASVVAAPSELVNAYKREFSFLETQKRSLQARKYALEQKLRNSRQMHEKTISGLEQDLLGLDVKIDKANEKISEVQGQLEKGSENNQLVDVTINQAQESLKSYGIKIIDFRDGERLTDEDILNIIFDKTGNLLVDLASIKKQEGVFFLEDGSEARGTITRIGQIASYGVSDKATGALIPAGEGYLKIWNPKDSKKVLSTSKALMSGSSLPEEIGIFIYDDPNKAVDPPREKDFSDVVKAGGVVGYVIMSFGVIAMLVSIVRYFRLQLAAKRTANINAQVEALMKKGQVKEALEFCKEKKGVMARVLSSVLEVIHKDRETLEYIISESLLREGGKLDLGKNIINAVAIVSPLLGLLGTVAGIIKTFDVIVQFGTGNPKMMAGGISEALVTTELGLIVAIPAYILGTLLVGWADSIKAHIEESTLKVVNLYNS